MQYDGEDRRAPEKWKIKKEVSLADILSFAAAALAVVYAYTTLDKRTSILEAEHAAQVAIDKRQDEELSRVQNRIEMRLDTLDKKLDRLIERR